MGFVRLKPRLRYYYLSKMKNIFHKFNCHKSFFYLKKDKRKGFVQMSEHFNGFITTTF